MKDIVVDEPGGGEDFALEFINGCRDVEITGEIRGDWNDSAIRIAGDSADFDISVHIDGPNHGQANGNGIVIQDNADYISIHDSLIRCAGHGVLFRQDGQLSGFRVRGALFDCEKNPVFTRNIDTVTVDNVWLTRVDTTLGSVHGITFQHDVTGL